MDLRHNKANNFPPPIHFSFSIISGSQSSFSYHHSFRRVFPQQCIVCESSVFRPCLCPPPILWLSFTRHIRGKHRENDDSPAKFINRSSVGSDPKSIWICSQLDCASIHVGHAWHPDLASEFDHPYTRIPVPCHGCRCKDLYDSASKVYHLPPLVCDRVLTIPSAELGDGLIFCRDGHHVDRYFLGSHEALISNGRILVSVEGELPIVIARTKLVDHIEGNDSTSNNSRVTAKKVKIPRPPNAYILYRKDRHHAIKEQNPDLCNNDICTWISLPPLLTSLTRLSGHSWCTMADGAPICASTL